MKSSNVLDAISNIDEKYIDEAATFRRTADLAKNGKKKSPGKIRWIRICAVAAAAFAVSVILPNTNEQVAHAMQSVPLAGAYFKMVTFRNYDYDDGEHEAHVNVNGVKVESADEGSAKNANASAREVNQKISEKTDQLIAEFKDSLNQQGYGSLSVSTDVVTDNAKYYAIRLTALTESADSYEENEYFVFSRKTGEVLSLKDLFRDGSDYTGVISDYLIRYMRNDMKKNSDHSYFVDDDIVPFTGITEDQQFYINDSGNIVITFNQGEVAPMYMGALQFEIPHKVVADILK